MKIKKQEYERNKEKILANRPEAQKKVGGRMSLKKLMINLKEEVKIITKNWKIKKMMKLQKKVINQTLKSYIMST